MTWVLVLYLLAGGSGDAGKALATIPGYSSKEQCTQAAEAIGKRFGSLCIPGPGDKMLPPDVRAPCAERRL